MFKTVAEARHLVSELVPGLQAMAGVEKCFARPSRFTGSSSSARRNGYRPGSTKHALGSFRSVYRRVSPTMVAELCHYVIIGHSERRAYFGETDETVNRKVKSALAHSLTPIVCVGETLNEYETGGTVEVVSGQVRKGLSGLSLVSAEPPETAGRERCRSAGYRL